MRSILHKVALFLALVALLIPTGCKPTLMPTPNLYKNGQSGVFSRVAPEFQTNFVGKTGNDIWGMKWRNFKINLKEQDTVFSGTVDYGLARVYDLYKDPGETQNALFPETWVPKAGLGQLGEHMVSLRTNPTIKSGTPDPYTPPAN